MSTDTIEKNKQEEKTDNIVDEPGRYNVIFLNDNHTPMDFVTEILITIFKHSQTSAEKIMLEVHEKGSAIVATYNYEIAEQKVTEAILCARKQGFPLAVQMEKA